VHGPFKNKLKFRYTFLHGLRVYCHSAQFVCLCRCMTQRRDASHVSLNTDLGQGSATI